MFNDLMKVPESREGDFLVYNSDIKKFVFMASIDYDGTYSLTTNTVEIEKFLKNIGIDVLTDLRGSEILEDDKTTNPSTHCYFLEA